MSGGKRMGKINSFNAIADENAKVLILGSMPSVKSLEKQQFYAHPQNQFWKIMFKMLKETYTDDYETKKAVIIKHNIALWDVLYECERAGSMDADIKNVTANDIDGFLMCHKRVEHIFCNGQASFKYFKKFAKTKLPCVCLPSTSPANARLNFENKYEIWRNNIMEKLI